MFVAALIGYVAGIATAVLVIAAVAFFKTPIERAVDAVAVKLHQAGPRPRGYVFEPEDEADVARGKIISRNAALGRDTPIAELQ